MKKLLIITIVAVMLVASVPAMAVSVSVPMPSTNATGAGTNILWANRPAPTTGSMAYGGYTGGTVYRSTIYYDVGAMKSYLDANYPGWSISSATLNFGGANAQGVAGNYSFHALTSPYVFTEVTWEKRNATTNWTNPGTDYNPTADLTVFWPLDSNYYTADVTSIVQGWMNNPSANYGWCFKGDDESSSGGFRGAGWSATHLGGGGVIDLVIIPEPNMLLLAGLGLALLKKNKKK